MTPKTSKSQRTVISTTRSTVMSILVMTCLAVSFNEAKANTIMGRYDCGQWTKRSLNHPMQSWLAGYLSGLNVMHTNAGLQPKDPLDELGSMDQAFVWIDNFCRSNPLRKLDGVAYELYEELIARRRRR